MTSTPALSRRCAAGQHPRCSGHPCGCRCGHPTWANARAAKAVALAEELPDSVRLELMAMIGAVDPDGREILPNGVGGATTGSAQPKGAGMGGKVKLSDPALGPPRDRSAVPAGLRDLPPAADETPHRAARRQQPRPARPTTTHTHQPSSVTPRKPPPGKGSAAVPGRATDPAGGAAARPNGRPRKTAVGTAPERAPVKGRRAPGAAPQVSPSRTRTGEGGGRGAPDAPAPPPATRRPPGPKPKPIPHGTVRGYFAHYRRRELPVCAPCQDAYNRDRPSQTTTEDAIRRATAKADQLTDAIGRALARAQRDPIPSVAVAAAAAVGALQSLRVALARLRTAHEATRPKEQGT